MDVKQAEFLVNGYVTFENLLPVEKIDRLHEAFMALLNQVRDRETEIQPRDRGDLRTGKGRMQLENRYTMYWPLDPPFADPELYENPVILDFLEQYWGTDDFFISCLHSNTPYPGSSMQKWHRDTILLTPGVGNQRHPHFGVKIPLVDTTEENGSFELYPCSQYVAEAAYEGEYDDILARGDFPHARRLNLKRGTMWVQDPRALHRGTPNRSDHTRPELCICYSLSWFRVPNQVELYRESFEGLSERGKKLFTDARLLD
jgi:ectoine hydroxylase-related dioxygenase (phytanoyl-CoA dioxygenase family)